MSTLDIQIKRSGLKVSYSKVFSSEKIKYKVLNPLCCTVGRFVMETCRGVWERSGWILDKERDSGWYTGWVLKEIVDRLKAST